MVTVEIDKNKEYTVEKINTDKGWLFDVTNKINKLLVRLSFMSEKAHSKNNNRDITTNLVEMMMWSYPEQHIICANKLI